MTSKKTLFPLVVAALTLLPAATSAVELSNPLGTTNVYELAGNIIKALLGLSGAAAFVMFIWGGLQLTVSHGDKKMVENGKNTLIWAALGLIFIFVAYAALKTVLEIIGAAS